jgi:diguanylate cyclase (GGDEF)-like protein
MMALYCRPDDSASASILDGLLRGTSTADTLRPVCDVINWHLHGSHVAITWWDGGTSYVSTGIPDTLAGADDPAGAPWVTVRSEATGRRAADLVGMDAIRRELASELGLGGYWIEPVLDEQSSVCALVTVWIRDNGSVPELHALGMSMAKDYTELIIRWSRQQRLLVDAARQDSLTGLANRAAFYEALATSGPRAVLYCDLDAFKPVNDELGHVAGDELLRAVAGRIKACVRGGDVVARLGGDEFAVLCAGASDEQAHDLAERIRAAVTEPYRVGGSTARLGISIGVAGSDGVGADDVLERADRALYQAKADGGGAVRWPEGP